MIRVEKGFSLVGAIFLIVIVAVIGAAMVKIASVQQQTSTFSILSSRALFAAESGVNWGIQQVVSSNACSPAGDGDFATSGDGDFSLTGGTSAGFNVSVTCTFTAHTEAPDPAYNVYRLTSTATFASIGDPDFIRRSIRASVTDAP